MQITLTGGKKKEGEEDLSRLDASDWEGKKMTQREKKEELSRIIQKNHQREESIPSATNRGKKGGKLIQLALPRKRRREHHTCEKKKPFLNIYIPKKDMGESTTSYRDGGGGKKNFEFPYEMGKGRD